MNTTVVSLLWDAIDTTVVSLIFHTVDTTIVYHPHNRYVLSFISFCYAPKTPSPFCYIFPQKTLFQR